MTGEERAWLLRFLRTRLEDLVRRKPAHQPSSHEVPAVWRQAGGVFVTLEIAHRVRGCSGSLQPRFPHRWQEAQHALERALHDARYRPIQPWELHLVRISVTVVLAIEPIENIRQLGGAEYGLVLRTPEGREGVVLPYEGRIPAERLRWAYRKAGVMQNHPVQLYRLRAARFSE